MTSVSYPTPTRNYCLFDYEGVSKRVQNGEKELENIKQSLRNPKSEDEVVEDLYVLNCMLDNGIGVNDGGYFSAGKTGVTPEKVAELYPELSKYNQTDSPNIQTFLAGIYRKTKIPDAFGPLVSMLIRNSIDSTKEDYTPHHFDPNEEIGGAILDYLA